VLVLADVSGVFTVMQLKLTCKLTELMASDTCNLIMLEINDLYVNILTDKSFTYYKIIT
jgi:hypothetical protein